MSSISLSQLLPLPGVQGPPGPGPGAAPVVVCATSRLALFLRSEYDRACRTAGLTRWPTLNTLTFGHLMAQWAQDRALREGVVGSPYPEAVGEPDAATDEPPESKAQFLRVLQPFEEQVLWERAIAASLDEASASLFDLPGMARTAIEADGLMCIWGVVAAAPAAQGLATAPHTEETRQFLAWQQAFLAACGKQGFIDTRRQQLGLVQAIESGHFKPRIAGALVLAGFQRLNPLEERLCQALEMQGARRQTLVAGERAGAITARSYPDAVAECKAAALWARGQLARDPGASIVIAVPNLEEQGHLLHDILEDTLCPELLRPCEAEAPRPFNLSLGLALEDSLAVSTALRLLELMVALQPIELEALRRVLLNPLWSAGCSEMDARARIDATLRKRLSAKAELSRILFRIEGLQAREGHRAPQLIVHLRRLCSLQVEWRSRKQEPSAWADAVRAALQQAGWMLERTPSSHEHQSLAAWEQELQRFSGLDRITGRLTATDMLRRLRTLCRDRVHQAQTQGQPPVQVLGLLEASGIQADALWVMGMTEGRWPPATRPNPLLPAAAQQKVGAPNAGPHIQMQFAQGLQHSLLHSAPELIWSWPRLQGDEQLAPSPLLAPWLPGQWMAAPRDEHWAAHILVEGRNPHLALPLPDHQAPAVGEHESLQGGTGLLRAQAICPAWAFHRYRLGAQPLDEDVDGLDARQKGELVHKALEHIWKQLKTSAALAHQQDAALQQLCGEAIDAALAHRDHKHADDPLPPRQRSLEHMRLQRLLMAWLTLEKKRGMPFAVLACERSQDIEIEGLKIRLTIDRIDELEAGGLLIIDYKTGRTAQTNSWGRDRISEPQLPIYAAFALPQLQEPPQGPVDGVAFAQVNLSVLRFKGVTIADGWIPMVRHLDWHETRKVFPVERFPDWVSVLRHWDASIRKVALELRQGHAAVVVHDEKAMSYCEVKPLLRLSQPAWPARRAQAPMADALKASPHG